MLWLCFYTVQECGFSAVNKVLFAWLTEIYSLRVMRCYKSVTWNLLMLKMFPLKRQCSPLTKVSIFGDVLLRYHLRQHIAVVSFWHHDLLLQMGFWTWSEQQQPLNDNTSSTDDNSVKLTILHHSIDTRWCQDTSDPRHFGPKTLRHWCRSVRKTLRH